MGFSFDADQFEYYLWDQWVIESPWPNTAVLQNAMSFLDENYAGGRDLNQFYVTQGELVLVTIFFGRP